MSEQRTAGIIFGIIVVVALVGILLAFSGISGEAARRSRPRDVVIPAEIPQKIIPRPVSVQETIPVPMPLPEPVPAEKKEVEKPSCVKEHTAQQQMSKVVKSKSKFMGKTFKEIKELLDAVQEEIAKLQKKKEEVGLDALEKELLADFENKKTKYEAVIQKVTDDFEELAAKFYQVNTEYAACLASQ